MIKKEPRDYQQDIISKVVNNDKSTLIQIPTGGGKTFIAYEIAKELIVKYNKQVLFVAPRENLMNQTAEEFKFSKPHIIHSSNKNDKNIKTYDFKTYPLLISTLQTAYRRNNVKPDVIIIDETHFGFDGKMIHNLIQSNKHSRIIGLSATPYDKYGHQLKDFDLVLDKYDMKYMIDNGYLVPLKSYKRKKINLNKVRLTKDGDYDETQLEKVVCNNHTIMEIVQTTKDKIEESTKTIVFAVTIKHADLLAEAYRNIGFKVKSLHSKSEEQDSKIINYFEKGYIKVLVSVSKLTTGFDVPATDCAVIARPTKSQNLYKQMVGRILRLSPKTNKTHAVLLDCGNVIDELGDPLAPIKIVEVKENQHKLKCSQCQSEKLKLVKIDKKSFLECQKCGYKKKIKEGIYRCKYCNQYSNTKSNFIFTTNKILLECNFCHKTTIISEYLGEEKLILNNDYISIKDNKANNILSKLPQHYSDILYNSMYNNNYNIFKKNIEKYIIKYGNTFNSLCVDIQLVVINNSVSTREYPIENLLKLSNTTKDFQLVNYLIKNIIDQKNIYLSKAIELNLLNVQDYLINNYDFILEELFYRITENIDIKYDLLNNSVINKFFIQYSNIWNKINANEIIWQYEDEPEELEYILRVLDFFFNQFNIKLYFNNELNSYKFINFIDARNFIQKLKFQNTNQWIEYLPTQPNNIPIDLEIVYKNNWTNIYNWLGIKNKNFIQNLQFKSNYFDNLNQDIANYKHSLSKKQFNEYLKIGHTINDDRIHTFMCNLNFSKTNKDIIKKIFLIGTRSGKFHKFLLSNPTISLENKLKFMLVDKKLKKRRIETFILALDINKNEVEQVNKIIDTFDNISNTLPYTPNIKDEKESSEIIMALNIRLKTLVKKYESDING